MILKINPKQSISQIMHSLSSGDTLLLEDGIYKEKIEIWKNDITLIAEHPLKAIISNKDYAHKIMEDNNECNTFRTYTLYVGGNNVKLKNLVIQNEATPSYIYGQAVALHVEGDHFTCEGCQLQSAQDTLFTGPMPSDLIERYRGFYPPEKLNGLPSKQIYRHCTILGDVDFIFGCATALFEECEICSISRNSLTPSYVCAPAHAKETPFGYLFYKCKFLGTEPAYLARPWRDYGCAAFIDCFLGNHILSEGYNKWNNTNRDKTARFFEYTSTSDLTGRVPWAKLLNRIDATNYVVEFKKYLSD